jgi:hypothetical protein
MKKIFAGILTLLLIGIVPPSFAIEKLRISVETSESHPFLPGYEYGSTGTLGDVWALDVKVLDADGDPAEGAIVRIHLGKKSVGTGRVGFNGVAEVKLILNKLGVQTFKVVASDDDPASKGESVFKLKVIEPKIVRVFTPIKVCENNLCETKLRPNPQLIMDVGCNDVNRYWTSYTTEVIKNMEHGAGFVAPATWPFTTTKRIGTMFARWSGSTEFPLARWIIDQATVPEGDDQDMRGFYDESLGTQTLCQTVKGALVILK